MAGTSVISLEIDVVNDGADLKANVTVEYDVVFSSYDQNSNQPYREVCRLIGDDTGITPAEDGVDDSITGGQLFPPVSSLPVSNIIASNGQASVHRTRTKTFRLNALDTDGPPERNPDELRAQVTLTPVRPASLVKESNQVVLNIN